MCYNGVILVATFGKISAGDVTESEISTTPFPFSGTNGPDSTQNPERSKR